MRNFICSYSSRSDNLFQGKRKRDCRLAIRQKPHNSAKMRKVLSHSHRISCRSFTGRRALTHHRIDSEEDNSEERRNNLIFMLIFSSIVISLFILYLHLHFWLGLMLMCFKAYLTSDMN